MAWACAHRAACLVRLCLLELRRRRALRSVRKMWAGCRRYLGVRPDELETAMLRRRDRLTLRRDVRLQRGACLKEVRVARPAAPESLGAAESWASGREPVSAERQPGPMEMLKLTDLPWQAAYRLESSMESLTPGARRARPVAQRLVSPLRDESRAPRRTGAEPQPAALMAQKSVPAREAADADLEARQRAVPQQASQQQSETQQVSLRGV